MLEITAGGFPFRARFEDGAAPETVAAFRRMLPLDSKIIHVRWSGEGGWIPMGDLDVDLGPENATSYPSPGELIFYPGGVSETELLLAYGYVAFASKAGALAERDVLGALPEHPPTELAEVLGPRDHRREVVSGER